MPRHPAELQTTLRPVRQRAGARHILRFWNWLNSSSSKSLIGGWIAGLFALAFCHQLFARLGGGLLTTGGAAAAVALALVVAVLTSRRGSQSWSPGAALVPAVWALALSWLADGLGRVYGQFDLEVLATPSAQFAAAFAAGLILLGVPTVGATRLVLRNRSIDGFWLGAGVASGCLTAAYGIAPWFGAHWAGFIAAGVTVAWVGRIGVDRWQASTKADGFDVATRNDKIAGPTPLSAADITRIVTGSIAAGLAVAALARLVQQLMPGTEASEWTMFAGFLGGAACAWRILHPKRIEWGPGGRLAPLLLAAIGCALPVVLFRSLTDLFLAATATFSSVPLLLSVRGLVTATVLSAAGALWAASVDWRSNQRNETHPRLLLFAIPALLAGVIAAKWLIVLGLPLPVLVAAAGLVPVTFAAPATLQIMSVRGRLTAGIGGITAATLLIAGVFGHTYDPSRSARLLFATNVFMAWRNSTESRLLPFLDDSRLVVKREGESGTYTVWKQHGLHLALRESGIPAGTFSPRPEIGPLFSGEIVPCVLPLVLHESPRHMLILGLGSGSGLAACAEFPIEDITCVEGDRTLVDVLEHTIWPSAQSNLPNDNRTRIFCAEPSLAIRARGGSYDVIYADSGQSGVSRGTPYFTREFYTAAARKLSPDGIFSQRFLEVDYGPWPLTSVLATLKSVFVHVAAIEVAPGELALLATQSEQGLDRPGLLERFQTPQARRTLANLGWDWSIVVNLAAYSGDDCEAITRAAPINTAANGLFAFRLPQETMRWGPKNDELAAVLSPHAGRIAQWPHVDGNNIQLLRRLSDVMREHDLMTSYPDQPWAYRKVVREELTKHPHTTIENGESGLERRLDPVDQRRVEYFQALGKVSQSVRPTLESLRRLEEFAEPFDPLLTYFLNHELAIYYARSVAAGSKTQLQHRLYTIYYSDPRDRSIRDVVDAIDLLISEPKLVSADERWDYLNALLSFLDTRWGSRGMGKPKSTEVVLNDLERSIDAIEAALAHMDRLCATVGVAEADWAARRAAVERALVRPLRSYRSELIPEYQREIEKTASSQSAEAQPSAN